MGYAATIHKTQGATADRASVLASKYMDRHATYVAMSRHVHQVDMYYAADDFGDFKKLETKLSREARKDMALDYIGRDTISTKTEKSKSPPFPKEATVRPDGIRARASLLEAFGFGKKPPISEGTAKNHPPEVIASARRKKPHRGISPSM